MNGANSLPDSDLSLIDVSPWGNTGQGVARQVTLSALARERKRRCGLAVVILRQEQINVECENRRSNAPYVPYALPLHLANQSATPFAPARYGVPSFFGVLLEVF
jgi:hypothetical protein